MQEGRPRAHSKVMCEDLRTLIGHSSPGSSHLVQSTRRNLGETRLVKYVYFKDVKIHAFTSASEHHKPAFLSIFSTLFALEWSSLADFSDRLSRCKAAAVFALAL